MNKDYCSCTFGCNPKDSSKVMYSADYDNLIERLTSARDEIDSLITLLESRKNKDNAINAILAAEYDDDDELIDTPIASEKEIDEYIKKRLDELIDKEIEKKSLNKKSHKPYKCHIYTPTNIGENFPYRTWF